MIQINKEQWTPIDGIELEESALEAVEYPGNTLVIAGPGSGKTELLAQKAACLFQTGLCREPYKILAISFKKDAAANLKERVVSRCGNEVSDRFVSLTYDAFAKQILDHFRDALPEKIKPSEDYVVNEDDYIKKILTEFGVQYNPGKIVDKCDCLLQSVDLKNVNESCNFALWRRLAKGDGQRKGCLTFKMIMKLAKYIVDANPKIKKAIQLTFPNVFLDEFQDTTDLQYAFVKSCFLNSKCNITAVGDDKQRIMSWAGAMKNGMHNFNVDFQSRLADGGFRLVFNHRSAPRLVELQKRMYLILNEKRGNAIPSAKWNRDDGEIHLIISNDEDQESLYVSSDIRNSIQSGVHPNEICIICKQKPGSISKKTMQKLNDIGIKARVEDQYQDLLKENIVAIILTLISLSLNIQQPDEMEYIESVFDRMLYEDSVDLSKLTVIENRKRELFQKVKENIDKKDLHQAVCAIINFFGEQTIKATYPEYQRSNWLDITVNKFEELFSKELLETEWDWLNAIDNFKGLNSIPVMTIHKSKGLEYSAVYFLGLEDEMFWNFKKQSEEDRCAFFVALSRAKKKVVFTFSYQRPSDKRNINRNHRVINEFFDLLQQPDVATVHDLRLER